MCWLTRWINACLHGGQWGWEPGGYCPGSRDSLGEHRHPAELRGCHSCQSLKDLRSSTLPSSWSTWITPPFTVLRGKGGLVQFSFCLSTVAFQLIEQMEILFLNYPVSPFDLCTSGRKLFGCICFLKMRVKADSEVGEAFYLYCSLPAPLIQFPKKNKERNSYNIKSQQGRLLLPSSHLKINLIYKDWEGYSDILQCK